jgi:hypothetical protein
MTPAVLVGLLAWHGANSGALHASEVASAALSQAPAQAALADAVIRAMAAGKLKALAAAIGGVAIAVAGFVALESYIHASPGPIPAVPIAAANTPSARASHWNAPHVAAPAGIAPAPGWPIALPGSVPASAAIADLDGSGRLAILVPCESIKGATLVNDEPAESVLLYAFYADGSPVPGWPAELVTPQVRAGREATRGRYVASWCSSPSVCSDGSGGSNVVLTTPYFLGLRVIDRHGKATAFHGGSQWANVPLVDLDGDGVTDIVTGAALMNLNGSAIRNWPPTHPLATVSGFAPCIGDAHRNGTLEVFQTFVDEPARRRDQAEVVGFDSTGQEMPGWRHPIRLPRLVGFGPVMGDVSGDEQMEIIACSGDLHVWTANGTRAAGTHDAGELSGILKQNVTVGSCAPTLADLDGDGKAEIIVYDPRTHALRAWHGDGKPLGSSDGTLLVLPTDEKIGTEQPDWHDQVLCGGVSVGDLGGDGVLDLFVGTFWVKWNPKTQQATASSFLDHPTVAACAQPTLCDLDGDGNADVVIGLSDGRVLVESTHMRYRANWMQWVTANGNFQHTGAWTKPAAR